MELGKVRDLVDEGLAAEEYGRIGDGDWHDALDWAKGQELLRDHGLSDEEQEREVAEEICSWQIEFLKRMERRPRSGHPSPPRERRRASTRRFEAPDWWPQESRSLLRRFAPARAEMLARLGLTRQGKVRYLTLAEVPTFLRGIAADEAKAGDWTVLDVPLSYERAFQANDEDPDAPFIDEDVLRSESVMVWRGFSRASLVEDGTLRRPTPTELAGEQRLARLADLAEDIAGGTGCSRAEAVCYVLCDVVPRLPYVQIEHRRAFGGVVIHLRDPRISARDLTSAFVAWQSPFWPKGRKPRAQRHQVDVVRFVDDYKRTHAEKSKWIDVWRAFAKEHEGLYKDLGSFRTTYYELRKRQQSE